MRKFLLLFLFPFIGCVSSYRFVPIGIDKGLDLTIKDSTFVLTGALKNGAELGIKDANYFVFELTVLNNTKDFIEINPTAFEFIGITKSGRQKALGGRSKKDFISRQSRYK
jgi:hypothetical protein